MKFFALILSVIVATFRSQDLNLDIYHTTDEIFRELENIKDHCSQQMEITQLNQNPDLRVVRLNNIERKKYNSFLLFGEHPRELISSETGLHLVKKLCKNESKDVKKLNELYTMQIVVNANPNSRKKVEQGEFCLRENENNVDINRNYDAHWEYVEDDIKQVSSGSEPFSEIETQTIKSLLEAQVPDYFVTVHSGTLGLFVPYAYSEEIPERNGEQMFEIMSQVNDKYCEECSVGAAGREVGYLCPGTSLDYVYDSLNTPYAYAMEIYEKDINQHDVMARKEQEEENASSYLALQSKEDIFHSRFLRNQQAFIQTHSSSGNEGLFDSEYEKCFEYFNPSEKGDYNFVVENWSDALIESMRLSAEQLENN